MWVLSDNAGAAAIAELETASDRSFAILVGAIVDSQLTDLVKKGFKSDDTDYGRKVRKEMFNSDGPVGTMGAKIGISYLMGFISSQAHSDLQTLKKIRNYFAHYAEHNSFESLQIAALCANFTCISNRVKQQMIVEPVDKPEARFAFDGYMYTSQGVSLHIENHEEALSTPRGRFGTTAKLVCAAVERMKDKDTRLTVLPIL
jgi:DNA-binding MltR family transcriptional regulator